MTRISVFIFLIFSLLAGTSCNTNDPISSQLESYTLDRFGLDLPEQRAYFVLIPLGQCPNCINYNASVLDEGLNRKTRIISGFDAGHFHNFDHYYFDTANYMERLPIVDYSNKIFVVEQGQVVKVLNITNLFAQLDQLERSDRIALK